MMKEKIKNQQLTGIIANQQKEIAELKAKLADLYRVSSVRLRELAKSEKCLSITKENNEPIKTDRQSYSQTDIERLVATKQENERIEMLLMSSREEIEVSEEMFKSVREAKEPTKQMPTRNASNRAVQSLVSFTKTREELSSRLTNDAKESGSERGKEIADHLGDQVIRDASNGINNGIESSKEPLPRNNKPNNTALRKASPLVKQAYRNLKSPFSSALSPNKLTPLNRRRNAPKHRLVSGQSESHLTDYISPVKIKMFEKLQLAQNASRSRQASGPVSYTHLTLPTICSV
eukprot:TRINITY_DN8643_c0_g2_i1.p1 TRINITY_DN8643_c0_g2~~TRINITY_DN8643_c0_g2_i1.p1  ORF type:complete len:291 (-),score=59.69 TRINITY_DN8643_c0_g2_i1:36-908(-)